MLATLRLFDYNHGVSGGPALKVRRQASVGSTPIHTGDVPM